MSDILQGTCTRDGLKVDGTAKISTSWNDKIAVPRNGSYKLEFGGKVGKSIDIYVNGAKYGSVTVSGTTTLNIDI
jgi:hypothetical protein